MNEKEVFDIVALGSGMALGLLVSALVALMGRVENRLFRILCACGTSASLLSLASLLLWLSLDRISPALDVRRLLAFSVMGFILAGVMEFLDRQKRRRQKKIGAMAARDNLSAPATISSRS
jgi:hypothetical protein